MNRQLAILTVLAIPSVLRADPPKEPDRFNGTVEPSTSVVVRMRVSAFLSELLVKDGAMVKKGELLARLDGRMFEADVKVAEAKLQLAQAELRVAEVELARATELVKRGVRGAEEVSRLEATAIQAKGSVAIAEANLSKAKLCLEHTLVVSPIDGKVGRLLVDPGNLVVADTTVLTTIVRTDPVYVDFLVPEALLLKYRKQGIELKEKQAVMISQGAEDEPRQGVIDFVENRVDANGRVKARAVLANPKVDLLPGMFVRVQLGNK